jgi:uncharacterized phiE125 gp8 family phage protein
MTGVYNRTAVGTVPVNCVDFKEWIHLPQQVVADDALITSLLSSATEWGEKYTRRDFRINTWQLRLNKLLPTICLRRDPVTAVTSITYLVGGVETTVDSSVYYLVKGVQTSSIHLNDGEEWPTDGDEGATGLLGSVVVTFTTTTYPYEDDIATAIKMHTAAMYSERGDCPSEKAARTSGATNIYDQFRVQRV